MKRAKTWVWSFALALAFTGLALADGGVTFQNIAENDGAGVTFRRIPSPRMAFRDAITNSGPIPFADLLPIVRPQSPQKPRGAPGVAIFDYDNDGDLDIYVTNGPGADNSLYSNQLQETGVVTFVDVGGPSGAGAFDQDSTGVCFGDIDNDGDHDLFVLGNDDPNRMFENQGDGTFLDITAQSNLGNDSRNSVSCTLADFNGDGLLDVAVANTYEDWSTRVAVFSVETTGDLEHNEVHLNLGGNQFQDVSAASGIENVLNMSGPGLTGAAYTWATSSVDYDLDGDTDLFFADNQGGGPRTPDQERGYLRVYKNDGDANFVEATVEAQLNRVGAWMGFSWGDLNCDGSLDFFSTNLGYIIPTARNSRWFFGHPDGTFTDSNGGTFGITPFGWGTSMIDYDNDADVDIVYHGGDDILSLVVKDNPGVLLQNSGTCSGELTWDSGAFTTNHSLRAVQGMAVGDLNNDGFQDIVTVSSFDIVPGNFLPWLAFFPNPPGVSSPFDSAARFEITFTPFVLPGFWVYVNPTLPNGTLTVELNSGNGNGWVEVTPKGSKGVIEDGAVNRDGIGAVVSFTPDGGPTSLRPIVGGSSYASQDALTAGFGLGAARSGSVEVLWPGGVRNRLDRVASGEHITFPEIPCSFTGQWDSFDDYKDCVKDALEDLVEAGVVSSKDESRFKSSAIQAFHDANPGLDDDDDEVEDD